MQHLSQVLVPTVIEEGNRGDRAFDLYSQLLRERIVFLGQEVDDQVANLIISQMLFLEASNNERDIYLYINSPGGVAYAGMAIYDVMQHVEPDVSTICCGMGMSAAAMILAGGAAGKRFALPNSRIMIHQGSAGTRGAPSDMEIQLREVLATTRRMAEIIAHHTGKPLGEWKSRRGGLEVCRSNRRDCCRGIACDRGAGCAGGARPQRCAGARAAPHGGGHLKPR